MPDIKRTVKLITKQHVIDEPSGVEGYPMRSWTIEIFILNENGEDTVPNIFEKAVYKLHPTFPNPNQTFKKPPFKIDEKGWGEFDMTIELHTISKGGVHKIEHDLNFQQERYEAKHELTFKKPSPDLLAALGETGSTGANGAARSGGKRDEPGKSKRSSKKDKMVDMEKLADGLQKLGEDDLLQIVQMIHDNKTSETYTKNDIENGEFHVDLYTLSDPLVKSLWDFTQSRVEL